MNLILIGYRAAGKTTVGRLLARRLGWSFLDTDELIEARDGRTIARMVEQEGWDHFRRLEKEVVAEVSALSRQVIATGGGAVLDPDNVAALRARGRVVWLETDVDTIRRRLIGDDGRPSLTGEGTVNEAARILAERRPAYDRAAHWRLDTAGLDPESVAETILSREAGLLRPIHNKEEGDVTPKA
jgi:shikimate kinase